MNQKSPFNQQSTKKKPPKRFNSHVNFIEALKETSSSIAKDTAKGISHDLIGGVAKQTVDTIFNAQSTPTTQPTSNQEFDFEAYLHQSEQKEKQIRQHQQVKYEYEHGQIEIFNQRERETNRQIQAIKAELQQLAKAMVNLDSNTQAAIHQETVEPGTYHLSFFQQLLRFLHTMRKRVVEAKNWANLHAQRNQAKSYYWQQSHQKKGGTSFMLSGERSVVTQTG